MTWLCIYLRSLIARAHPTNQWHIYLYVHLMSRFTPSQTSSTVTDSAVWQTVISAAQHVALIVNPELYYGSCCCGLNLRLDTATETAGTGLSLESTFTIPSVPLFPCAHGRDTCPREPLSASLRIRTDIQDNHKIHSTESNQSSPGECTYRVGSRKSNWSCLIESQA